MKRTRGITVEKNKKYFWLKLKRDFFKRHDIKIIESRPNGEKYVLFYLKLLAESIDHSGRLRFNDTIPYNEEMLATITGTDIDVVRTAIRLFADLEMMELMSDGTFYMNEVQKMVGHETYWAEQKRKQREAEKQLKLDNVQSSPTCPSKSKSLDIELNKEQDTIKPFVKQVLDYLNKKIGTNYKSNAKKNITPITARIKEGYTLEQFKTVIDKKYKDWFGTDYQKFLRPETLFGTKFDGYLNQLDNPTNNNNQIQKKGDTSTGVSFSDVKDW